MFRPSRLLGTLAVGLAAAAAALSTTQVASAAPDPNPSANAVPAGNRGFLIGHAPGVQKYACIGNTWGGTPPKATPDATLLDDNGKVVATHFGGPTWRATDGSLVVGALPPDAAVTVDPSAIPWLKLHPASTTAGMFAKTTFIQRVN